LALGPAEIYDLLLVPGKVACTKCKNRYPCPNESGPILRIWTSEIQRITRSKSARMSSGATPSAQWHIAIRQRIERSNPNNSFESPGRINYGKEILHVWPLEPVVSRQNKLFLDPHDGNWIRWKAMERSNSQSLLPSIAMLQEIQRRRSCVSPICPVGFGPACVSTGRKMESLVLNRRRPRFVLFPAGRFAQRPPIAFEPADANANRRDAAK